MYFSPTVGERPSRSERKKSANGGALTTGHLLRASGATRRSRQGSGSAATASALRFTPNSGPSRARTWRSHVANDNELPHVPHLKLARAPESTQREGPRQRARRSLSTAGIEGAAPRRGAPPKYGTVKRSASIVYGRASGDAEQQRDYMTLSEAECARQDSESGVNPSPYRPATQIESRSFEVTGLSLPNAGAGLISVSNLRTTLDALNPANDLDFDEPPTSGVQRRLLDRQQQTFYADNASTEAAFGQVGLRALPYKTYQLALTPGNVALLIDKSDELTNSTNAFNAPLLTSEGAYIERETGYYWTQSGRAVFSPSEFYLPVSAIDPFGGASFVTWDTHKLLPESATDPVGNVVTSENDYRVLAPKLVTDPNLNRSEVEFDALGMVVATAVMGKDDGSNEGDTIDDPTTRLEYDLLAYQDRQEPAFVKTIAKETHGATDGNTKFQTSFAYSDGFGRVIQQKVQAEPGDAPLRDSITGELERDTNGDLILGNVTERWVGTGRTVFNNKGNPVKQYEPFFSSTSAFEPEEDLVDWGVTPIIRYDSIDRVIQTDLPDGTFTKVVFDSWQQETWDQNDSVLESEWYAERGSPSPTASEPSNPDTRAAWLSAQHAATPTVVHLDSLGRPYKSVAHNVTGTGSGRVTAFYTTRTELDIEGNTLSITDARGNTTIEQTFDVLQRRLLVTSPDAGERLSIQDVAGKPLRAYNSRGFTSRAEYDDAQRPTHSWVKPLGATEFLAARMSYGEALDTSGPSSDPNNPSPAQALNLRGQVHLVFDTAGKVKTVSVDFKGNVLEATRTLAQSYQTTPDWSALASITNPATLESTAASSLEAEVFTTETEYDALNRVVLATSPTSATSPAPSVTRPVYNEANFLEQLHVAVRGGSEQVVVDNLDYNARGQRILCEHANPTTGDVSHSITYTYDEKTFRLTRLLTTRTSDSVVLQDLRYFFDAVGNITEVQDHATTSPLFSGSTPVSGTGFYRYDALYRLTYAEGREHPGQQPNDTDPARGSVPHANDLTALERYEEVFEYDEVGNIDRIGHQSTSTNWTRSYDYATTSNRLNATSVPGDLPEQHSATYTYDSHGSMVTMPHLSTMAWDFADRLQHTERSGGGGQHTCFTYDMSGERVRKVYVHNGITEERIYLGGYEIFRHWGGDIGDALELERETIHVMDDARRVAMVETATVEDEDVVASPVGRWRFQLGNHLDSVSMELNEAAGVISYEEYHPYGSTAFHTAASGAEVSAKRYRYTGKERDESTGLYYHGARYYAAWLGRWTAADPLAVRSPGRPDLNMYAYGRGTPLLESDPQGTDGFIQDTVRGIRIFFGGRDEKAATAGKAAGEAAAASSTTTSAMMQSENAGKAAAAVARAGTKLDTQQEQTQTMESQQPEAFDPDDFSVDSAGLTNVSSDSPLTVSVERNTSVERPWPFNPEAIVLHYTAHDAETLERNNLPDPSASSMASSFSPNAAAHFAIDREGNIVQAASLTKSLNHVGPTRQRPAGDPNAPADYPKSTESIGIELVASYDARTGQYQKLTDKQIQAATWLVGQLQSEYGLTEADTYAHGEIAFKHPSRAEGKVEGLTNASHTNLGDDNARADRHLLLGYDPKTDQVRAPRRER